MISNCGHDENNRYSGGKAGDQTGTEWRVINWYNRPWKCVLRHPDAKVRKMIASMAKAAAVNNKIGYDQSERYTFWEHLNYIAEYEVANLPALRTDAKRRSVEGKMQKLKDLYLNDLITMDEFKLDREKLLMQLEKINAEDSRPVKDLSYLKNFLKMDFESVYDSLSIPERRELWRSIVKEIRVDHDKNIHIIIL